MAQRAVIRRSSLLAIYIAGETYFATVRRLTRAPASSAGTPRTIVLDERHRIPSTDRGHTPLGLYTLPEQRATSTGLSGVTPWLAFGDLCADARVYVARCLPVLVSLSALQTLDAQQCLQPVHSGAGNPDPLPSTLPPRLEVRRGFSCRACRQTRALTLHCPLRAAPATLR